MKKDNPVFYFFLVYGWLVFLLIFLNEKYGFALLTMMMYSNSKIIEVLFGAIIIFLGFMIVPTFWSIVGLYHRIKEAIFPKEF